MLLRGKVGQLCAGVFVLTVSCANVAEESYCEALNVAELADSASHQSLISHSKFTACYRDSVDSKLFADHADVTVVDVRPPDRFAKVHVEGALNVPLHLIPTRQFLKSVPLVLVGDDAELSGMLRLCTQLRRERGQRVWVEPSGVRATWAKARLFGADIAPSGLPRVSGGEFLSALPMFSWSILVISDQENEESYPPTVSIISPSIPVPELSAKLAELGSIMERVLVVPGGASQEQLVLSGLSRKGFPHVRVLDGGVAEFRRLVALKNVDGKSQLASTAAPKSCGQTSNREQENG